MEYIKDIDLKDRDTQIAIGATVGAVAGGLLIKRYVTKRRENAPIPPGAYTQDTLPKGAYDAIIVGAGTCGLMVG